MKRSFCSFMIAALSVSLLIGCAKEETKESAGGGSAPVTEETGELEAEVNDPVQEEITEKETAVDTIVQPDTKEAEDLSDCDRMWISESARESEEDIVLEIYTEGSYDEIFDSLKKVDWDNDGVNEYILCGSIINSGILFDMSDGELTAVYGFGPYGMGWHDVAYIDGAYWIYEASGNSGKFYNFSKYNTQHEVTDQFCYSEEYDMHDDGTVDASFAKGSDYDKMSEISEAEFEKMCGENGLIYQDLPGVPDGDNEAFTNTLHDLIKEFFEGKRPALSKCAY